MIKVNINLTHSKDVGNCRKMCTINNVVMPVMPVMLSQENKKRKLLFAKLFSYAIL